MSQERIRGLVGGLSLVVLGAVLGVTIDRVINAEPAPVQLSAESIEAVHEKTLAHLQQELGLDDAQVDHIHETFIRHQGSVDSSWQKVRPHLISASDSVHAHIAAVLRPEQREGFEIWLERQGSQPLHMEAHTTEHRPTKHAPPER